MPRSHRLQGTAYAGGELDGNRVSDSDDSAGDDHGHHACFAYEAALLVALEDCGHESPLVLVELTARVAQAGDLDDRVRPEPQAGSGGQREQVDTAGEHVLTEGPRAHGETGCGEFVQQLGVHQVHLAQVGCGGIALDPGEVLHGRTRVRVTLDAEAGDQRDPFAGLLGEAMPVVGGHRFDDWCHADTLPGRRGPYARPVVVVLSLACALAYGLSDFLGGLLSRRTSPWAVAVVGQSAATVLTLALALGTEGAPGGSDWWWSALAGVGSGTGAAFLYRGLGAGSMSVVAPVSALFAALVPVAVGVATGERPTWLTWLGVGCALPAIWLVSRVADHPSSGPAGRRRSAELLDGLLAGLGFGVLFSALGQVPDGAGFGPLALTQATAVVATIGLAVALRAPWLPRGRAAGQAIVMGALGTLATVLFLLATQTGLLTVAAVLSALYPATTVLLAALVLHERMGRSQGVGLLLAGAAVALVAAG